MSFKSVESAEVIIRIHNKLNDDTEPPKGFRLVLSDPGYGDQLSYLLSRSVNMSQLQQIYNILQKEAK